jgi:cellobiose-specific phosphotransferase system component IIB
LTERLLLGYKALDKDERIRIEQLPESEKWKEMERLDPWFVHPNIQPFDELTEESVRKDEVMVQCILGKLKCN